MCKYKLGSNSFFKIIWIIYVINAKTLIGCKQFIWSLLFDSILNILCVFVYAEKQSKNEISEIESWLSS